MFMRFMFLLCFVFVSSTLKAGMFGVPYSAGIPDHYVKGLERFLMPIEFAAQESLQMNVMPCEQVPAWDVFCPSGAQADWASVGPQEFSINTLSGGAAALSFSRAVDVDFAQGFSLLSRFFVSQINGDDDKTLLLFEVADLEASACVQVFSRSNGLTVTDADTYVHISYDFSQWQEFRLVVKDSMWKLFAGHELLFSARVRSSSVTDGVKFGEVSTNAGCNAACTWQDFAFAQGDYSQINRFGIKAEKICVDGYEAVNFEVVEDIAIGFVNGTPEPGRWCGVYLCLNQADPGLFFAYEPPEDPTGIIRVAWVRIGQSVNSLIYCKWVENLCLIESGNAVFDLNNPSPDIWTEAGIGDYIPPVDCLMLGSFGAQEIDNKLVYMHIGSSGLMPVVCGSASSVLVPVDDGRLFFRIEGNPARAWFFAGGYFDGV